jgi:hypothetical protein
MNSPQRSKAHYRETQPEAAANRAQRFEEQANQGNYEKSCD